MRILYLSNTYVPSRRASSVQIMNMCGALTTAGHEVVLVSKKNRRDLEPGVEDDFAFYGVAPFTHRKRWRPRLPLGSGIFLACMLQELLREGRRLDLVYGRDLWGSWLATRLRLPVLFECHGPPGNSLNRRLFRQMIGAPSFRRLVPISAALRGILQDQDLLPTSEGSVIIAHDAARQVLPAAASSETADKKSQIGYVGHLYEGRGVELILELARRLPACQFHLVGGTERDLERWQSACQLENVRFHGFVQPGQLATLYALFDILLMPYQQRVTVASGKTDTSAFMSPMKMFEYMATGKAIIASDLPVLREVLQDESNALLVSPDQIDDWEGALRRLLAVPDLALRLGQRARLDLETHHTWEARVRRVLADL